jgi:hypothetical protein
MAQNNYTPLYRNSADGLLYFRNNDGSYTEQDSTTSTYTVYTATLTQDGTDAPVANVLENTIIGGVWSRPGVLPGIYILTNEGAFPNNKTICVPFAQTSNDISAMIPISDGGSIVGYYTMRTGALSPDAIQLQVYDSTFNNVDLSELGTGSIYLFVEIRVYP